MAQDPTRPGRVAGPSGSIPPSAAPLEASFGRVEFGWVAVLQAAGEVHALFVGEEKVAVERACQLRFAGSFRPANENAPELLLRWLEAPSGPPPVRLALDGTPFQRTVWQGLMAIPAGKTVSYGELARSLGRPRSVRAVARACAANLQAVAIPCHRVLRSDGGLGGYRWGVTMKARLLAREGRVHSG